MSDEFWVNEKYLENDKLNELRKEFLQNKPFPHISLSNFLNKDKAKEISKVLNSLDYYEEDHDLYKFDRTVHFKNIDNKEIQKIKQMLFSEKFVLFIEKITNTRLSREARELHSLRFSKTHYLLCHDDKVQGRKIAFILNFSENWNKNDGGELDLFDSVNGKPEKIVKTVLPEFNQFNMFLVTNDSFHQVREIISDKQRISIGGWFYDE